jgi:CRISPR/Cas system-associated endonuclease Cas1
MSRVLQVYGYDLGCGFLHDGIKLGRASLVWDAIEEHRVRLAERLFGYMRDRAFKASEFTMLSSGEVRTGQNVCKEVALETIRALPISRLMTTANWIGKMIKENAG